MKFTLIAGLLMPLFLSAQNSLMWEIGKPGSEDKSYMYGTMHVADTNFFLYGERALRVLDESRVFMPEIEMDFEPAQLVNLMSRALMQDGTQLSELLSTNDYNRVDEAFKDRMGMGVKMFESIQPLFLSVFLATSEFETNSGRLMDDLLQQHADSVGMKIKALETIEEQLDAFTSISYKKQAILLVQGLDEMGKEGSMMDELKRLYKEEDIDGLLDITLLGSKGPSRKFEKDLILERNARMAHRIDQQLKDGPAFIAIGALHLPGQKGLINRLRKRGYELSPVYRSAD